MAELEHVVKHFPFWKLPKEQPFLTREQKTGFVPYCFS